MVKEILRDMELEELIGTEFENLVNINHYKSGEYYFVSEKDSFELPYLVKGKLRLTVNSSDGIEYFYLLDDGEFQGINFSLCDFSKLIKDRKLDLEVYALKDSIVATLPLKKIFEIDLAEKDKLLKKLLIKISTINANMYKEYIYYLKKTDEEIFLNFLKNNSEKTFTSYEVSLKLNIILRTIQRIVKILKGREILRSEKKKFFVLNKLKLKNFIKSKSKNNQYIF